MLAAPSLLFLLAVLGAADIVVRDQQLYEGSECYNEVMTRRGVCRRLTNCPWAQQEIWNRRHPQVCTWIATTPVVCCPSTGVPTSTPTSMPTSWPTSTPTNMLTSTPDSMPTSTPSSLPTSWPTSNPASTPVSMPTSTPASWPTSTPTIRLNSRSTSKPAVSQREIAKKMCGEYTKFLKPNENSLALLPLGSGEDVQQCTVPADAGGPLVVGGQEAKPREFPHMALIGYGQEDNIVYECGGSLISPDFVITAAHCVYNSRNIMVGWVLLGELDYSTSEEDAKPQRIGVNRTVRHPDYRPPQYYSDVALLKLTHAADMNSYVRPACIYTERSHGALRNVDPVATGWGFTENGGSPSDKLMKVTQPVQPYSVCNVTYRSSVGRRLPKGILDETQLCAGDLKGGKDTCQGDSGGPLQIFSTEICMYHIVGITSFGKACGFANSPAIYSRVSYFVPWIESIVWPHE